MGLHTRSLFPFLIVYCAYLSPFVTANVKLTFTNSNKIELLRRIKAADIKTWMNMTADPCNDFYNYACGNWDRIYAGLLQEQTSVSKYNIYESAMEKRIQDFLQNLMSGDIIHDKIHDFLQSCKDIKKNPAKYKNDVNNLLSEEFGKFSYLKDSDQHKATTHFNWWSTVATIYSLYDLGFIVNIDVDYDLKSHNRTSIYIGQPLKRKYHTSKARIEKRFANLPHVSTETAKYIANDVHAFSEAIRNASIDHAKSGLPIGEQYTLHNITDLRENYNALFDIETYLKIALNITEVPEQIYVETGGYFDALIDIFNNTKPETVEHYILYMLWEYIFSDFDSGNVDDKCGTYVIVYFGKYIQHAVYGQFRSIEFETQIRELWHDIKSVFHDDLQTEKYQWISKASRDHAIKKLNNMKFKISSYDDENFEPYFQNLQIDLSNFALNMHNVIKHFKSRRGTKLAIRTEDPETVFFAAYSPAYFPNLNEIRMPVSFLQPFHIWHSSYPKAILYANIGSPVAHEMIHAFDDSGRHYDADGNTNTWWDEKATKEFESRRHCFQAQYHNYTFAGVQLPDLAVQGENIADNAAVQIAYKSYMRWLEKAKLNGKHLDEKFKSWFNTSAEELFFISFGQYRCETLDDYVLRQMVMEDVHAPLPLRAIGPLSNFPEFSKVFQCREGTAMNPTKKCALF